MKAKSPPYLGKSSEFSVFLFCTAIVHDSKSKI